MVANIMKVLLFPLTVMFFSGICYSQKSDLDNWNLFQEELKTLKFTRSEIIKEREFLFDVKWCDSLSYSSNIGYYGGVSELKVSIKGKYIQTIRNIEDGIGLGEILVSIYDYNMDGFQDFAIQRDCGKMCYEDYYLYDDVSNLFFHEKKWDYMRTQNLNKVKNEM